MYFVQQINLDLIKFGHCGILMPMNTPSNFMTIAQVAEELQVSAKTIRRFIKTGRIRAFKLGQGMKAAVRIKREELERLQRIGYEENMQALRKELLEE